LATNIRFSDATTVFAMNSCWPLRPDHVHPIVSKLSLRYHDVPWLERVIGQVERCQEDETFRQTPRIATIWPLVGRLAELEDLRRTIKVDRQPDWQAAERIAGFERRLMQQATGGSLDALYHELPEELRGAVELAYDSHNNPSLRLYEKMLYADHRYDARHQSFRFFVKSSEAEWLPVRLPNPETEIALRVRFDDARMDRLFAMDVEPRPREEVMDLLELKSSKDPRLARLFTDQPVRRPEPWTGPGPRIRYLGHAGALVEWNGISVLVDPLIPCGSAVPGEPRYSFSDLPARIDYVLITHAHDDHYELSSLLRLRHRIGCLVVPRASGLLWDYSLKAVAQRIGFKHVVELDAFDSLAPGPDMEIVSIPFVGEHGELFCAKSCWLVRAGTEQMLFAADSKTHDPHLYENVRNLTGDIQTVFIGTCCLGQSVETFYPPLFGWFEPRRQAAALEQRFQTRQTDGCDAAAAWSVVKSLGAKRVYIYALGLEPWLVGFIGPRKEIFLTEAQKLIDTAYQSGFTDARLLSGVCDLRLT
jgi:diiron non-heme beta-hydroxylase-like protein/beta-lactamase family protein